MRRMNNLITLFSAIFAFFFGCFLTAILTDVEKCVTKIPSKLEQKHDIFLTILILSAPRNFERRQIIRDTWLQTGLPLTQPYYPEGNVYIPEYDQNGFLMMETVAEQSNRMRTFLDWMDSLKNSVGNKRHFKIKRLFAIGARTLDPAVRKRIYEEQNSQSDLLLLPDLQDSYNNLTLKLLHSIELVTSKYSFSYLLKTDDDTYVKMEFLMNELVSYDRKLLRKSQDFTSHPHPELYWGYFNGRANIKTKGQWKETNYYLCNRYSPYAVGGGYVITRGIAEYVSRNSKYLSTYKSEDISMGTWLVPLKNVYRRHDPRFDTEYMPRKCKPYHIILHKRTVQHMKDISQNRLCTFEATNEVLTMRPPEYYYDWTKSPDKCCDSL